LIYKCGYLNSRTCKSKRLIYKCGYLNSRICKSNTFIYKCGYTNSRICKSFFTLKFELHHTTFIFFSPLCLLFSLFMRLRTLAVHLYFCIFINLCHCEFLELLSSSASSLHIIFFFVFLIFVFSPCIVVELFHWHSHLHRCSATASAATVVAGAPLPLFTTNVGSHTRLVFCFKFFEFFFNILNLFSYVL